MQSQHSTYLPQLNSVSVVNPAGGWESGTWLNMESGTFLYGWQFRSLLAGSWGIYSA